MELIYHMKLMDTLRSLWDKTITIDEAQAQIIAEADRVIGELNVQEALPQ
jgi:hypothetical protein